PTGPSYREPTFDELPPEIASKLRAANRRITSIVFWRGLFAVFCTLQLAIASVMLIDAMVVIFSVWVRWLLTLGIVAVTLRVTWVMLIKPLGTKRTPSSLARLLERGHPELEERLSTVVELLADPTAVSEGGQELLNVVKDSAILDAGDISPRREFTMSSVKPKVVVAVSIFAIFAILFICWPKSVGRLMLRAVAPNLEVDNLYADSLQVAPGDAVILEGTPFQVELAVLGGFPGQAYLHLLPEGRNSEISERMSQLSAEKDGEVSVRNYRFGIGAVEHSFTYRVSCGSALTRSYSVTCLPEPSYTNLSVQLSFPSYTKRGVQKLEAEKGDIQALPGTIAEISALPNRAMKESVCVLGETEIAASEKLSDGRLVWRFPLKSDLSGSWAFRFVDENDFTNKPAFYSLDIVADMEPVAKIVEPEERSYKLPESGEIPFVWTASDDYGIDQPMIQVRLGGNDWFDLRPVENWDEVRPGQWTGRDVFRLSELKLANVNTVRFRLVAKDACPEAYNGPHCGFSEMITIELDAMAESFFEQAVAQEVAALTRNLDDVEKELTRALQFAENGLQTARLNQDKPTVDQMMNCKESLGKADRLVRDFLSRAMDSMLSDVAPEARTLLQKKILPAADLANEVVFTAPASRVPVIERLIALLRDAQKSIGQLKQEVEKEAESVMAAERLDEMAGKEDALAEKLQSEMTEEDWKKWQEEQEKLMKEMEEMALDTDPLKEQKEFAEKLTEDAKSLEERQKELAEIAEELSLNPEDAKANEKLNELTNDMPQDSSSEERLAQAQQDLASDMEDFRQNVDSLQQDMNGIEDMPMDNLNQASDSAQQASDQAQEAANALQEDAQGNPQGNEQQEGESSGEQQEGESSGEQSPQDQMQQAADAMSKAAQALDAAKQQIGEKSAQMAQEMAQAMQEAMNAMQEALDAAQQESGLPQDGQQQDGQQQDGQQQDGQPQDGQQQDGQQQDGQQQDGQQQNGPQQPPQDQQGQQSPDSNEPPKGGDFQAPPGQQKAQQKAQQAAEAMKQMAQQQQQANAQKGPKSNQPSQPNQPTGDQKSDEHTGMPTQLGQIDPRLGGQDRTADWLKSAAGGGSEVLSSEADDTPEEYRGMVKDYFESLSNRK
ncbi:MAG: hypothetical protein ACI4QT_01365, partial [Kiritimatiellia bacterium]